LIRLIIFDLDGILVNTKDIHFEALNKALKDFDFQPISYRDHINKFDGKPTRQKLLELNIPDSIHGTINRTKQYYTQQFLLKLVQKDPELINLFKKLKSEGFLLHVASNSIKNTVDTVLNKLGITEFIDFSISNEEVKHGKPHPEMYLMCMIHAGVGPRETLVIEDSYVGRQGGFNSGACISSIKNRDEVRYDMIKSSINEFSGNKQMWKSNDLNIVIPMAGAGSRFQKAGYTFPKPLIEIRGKPMIQVVVENINIQAHYIFIVRKEHYDTYNLKPMLELLAPGCSIITIDHLTEGAACTVLLAKDLINSNNSLLIANSDQFIEWDSCHFMYAVQNGNIDGMVPVFYNTHPKWSYAKTDDQGFIQTIKEKEVISTNATVGIYYWKKGSDFVTYAERMISKNIRVNNEFFVAPIYNEAIEDGKIFKLYTINKMWGLGIPEDLDYFLAENKL